MAQRARNKPRVRAIHAKIANRRKDFLHKLSIAQVRTHQAIFFGDVSASKLAKTKMAKSVLDPGWSTYRTMLLYKSDDAGVWFRAMDESYSTQERSACGARTGPRGLAGLSVRHGVCIGCGKRHDRDVNAARVIRDRGLQWLASEISSAAVAPQNIEVSGKAAYKAGARKAPAAAGRGRPAVGISVLPAQAAARQG